MKHVHWLAAAKFTYTCALPMKAVNKSENKIKYRRIFLGLNIILLIGRAGVTGRYAT